MPAKSPRISGQKKKLALTQGKFLKDTGASFGGDKRDRTADLLNAIQALSQLSYTPIWKVPNAPDLYHSDWLLI